MIEKKKFSRRRALVAGAVLLGVGGPLVIARKLGDGSMMSSPNPIQGSALPLPPSSTPEALSSTIPENIPEYEAPDELYRIVPPQFRPENIQWFQSKAEDLHEVLSEMRPDLRNSLHPDHSYPESYSSHPQGWRFDTSLFELSQMGAALYEFPEGKIYWAGLRLDKERFLREDSSEQYLVDILPPHFYGMIERNHLYRNNPYIKTHIGLYPRSPIVDSLGRRIPLGVDSRLRLANMVVNLGELGNLSVKPKLPDREGYERTEITGVRKDEGSLTVAVTDYAQIDVSVSKVRKEFV